MPKKVSFKNYYWNTGYADDFNTRIKAKNSTADPEIRFLKKSISKPYGRATAMPTA